MEMTRGNFLRQALTAAGALALTGGRAAAEGTDIGSIESGRRLVDAVIERHGHIDIVINNAGFAGGGGTAETPDEAGIDALLDVHLKGALGTMAAALGPMRAAGYGRIINTVLATVHDNSLRPRFTIADVRAGVLALLAGGLALGQAA